jgi:hypothetical protein
VVSRRGGDAGNVMLSLPRAPRFVSPSTSGQVISLIENVDHLLILILWNF